MEKTPGVVGKSDECDHPLTGALGDRASFLGRKAWGEVFVPIARLRGEEGDLHVRYMIRVTSTCDDVFRANPTGQLFSRMGDTQPQGILLVANLASALYTHSDTD
jgi:hypothetical protein